MQKGLEIPKLSGSVGDGAANAPNDVTIVQKLLNLAVVNGDLPGFVKGPEDGKVTAQTVKMIASYQAQHGISKPKVHNLPKAIVEPKSRTLTLLAKNPLVDSRWSEYDAAIKQEVDGYNKRLKTVAGFQELDWRWVKAMVWTEVIAGPDDAAWSSRPMQIGNPGDKGLEVVQKGLDHSDLVVSAEVRTAVKSDATGALNIRAGVAYLYHRAAFPHYKYSEIIDSSQIETYQLAAGETLSGVASKVGTTVDELMRQSGLDAAKASKLQIGATLKYRKAHKIWQITGWDAWKDAIKAYNSPGDPKYVEKVTKAYEKIKSYWAQ